MTRWRSYVIELLLRNHMIIKEEREIYEFGFNCLVLKGIHCVSYFCIAAMLGMIPELLVIGCVLIPLRRNAGGYHAKTKMGCYVFSCTYIFIILLISRVFDQSIVCLMALALADGIIIRYSPVDNENKRLDEKELLYYRKKSRILLIAINLCYFTFGFLLNTFLLFPIGPFISLGVCASAFLLILEKSKGIVKLWRHELS